MNVYSDFTYSAGGWWQYTGDCHGYWLRVSGQGRHIVQMLVTARRDDEGHKREQFPMDATEQERAVLDPEVLDLWALDLFPDTDSDEYPCALVRPYADRVVEAS